MFRVSVVSIALCTAWVAGAAAREANNWIYAAASGGVVGIETLQVVRDETTGILNGFSFLYSPSPLSDQQGNPYHFQVFETEFDCGAATYLSRYYTLYNEFGDQISDLEVLDGTWRPISDNGLMGLAHGIFCENHNLTDSATAPTLADAFIGAMALAHSPELLPELQAEGVRLREELQNGATP